MSISVSDFIPLEPFTWNPFFESSKPRAVVKIQGRPYALISYSITYNAHGSTDEATIVLPISSNPDFSAALDQGDGGSSSTPLSDTSTPGAAYGADATDNPPVYVEIYAGFPSNPQDGSLDTSQLSLRFYGVIDRYKPSFSNDTISSPCRSFAAPLVDDKLTTSPINMTSVQFVAACAAHVNGLKTVVMLRPGVAPITVQEALAREFVGGPSITGAIYNQTYWQMLLKLAQFDDVDVWVDGDTLYYVAPDLISRTNVTATYGSDISSPEGDHSLQSSKNVRVEVRTYKRTTKVSTTHRVQTDGAGGTIEKTSTKVTTSSPVFGTNETISESTSPTGVTTTSVGSKTGGSFNASPQVGSDSGLQKYIYYVPNLTPARCQQLARAKWRQITMHEFAIDFSMPVTKAKLALFSITSLLRVRGLPYYRFNDTYWPRRIGETYDLDQGWNWDVHALNHTLPQGAV